MGSSRVLSVGFALALLVAMCAGSTLRSLRDGYLEREHRNHHHGHGHHHDHDGHDHGDHGHRPTMDAMYTAEAVKKHIPHHYKCVTDKLAALPDHLKADKDANIKAVRSCVTRAAISARLQNIIDKAETRLDETGLDIRLGKNCAPNSGPGAEVQCTCDILAETDCDVGYECHHLERETKGWCMKVLKGECLDDNDCKNWVGHAAQSDCVIQPESTTYGRCMEPQATMLEMTEPIQTGEKLSDLEYAGSLLVEPTSAEELAKKPTSSTTRSPGSCGINHLANIRPRLTSVTDPKKHVSELEELSAKGTNWMSCGKTGFPINCDDPNVRSKYAYTKAVDSPTKDKKVRMGYHIVHASGLSQSAMTLFKSKWETNVKDQTGTLNQDYASAGISFKSTIYWWASSTLAAIRIASVPDTDEWCQWCKNTNNGDPVCAAQIDCCAVRKIAGLPGACMDFDKYTEDVFAAAQTGPEAPNPNRMFSIFPVTFTNSGLLGWANFPWDGKSGYSAMNKLAVGANQRTLSHEIGHGLGLYHTFHGVDEQETTSGNACTTCYESSPTDYNGDMCGDTNPTPMNFACAAPSGVDTCTNKGWPNTPLYNFMGYGPDSCMNTFTPCQQARMRCWLAAGPNVKNFVEEDEKPAACGKVCQHGGAVTPACACTCTAPWAGDTCETCTKTCGTHGTIDPLSCKCNCDAAYSGDLCEVYECNINCGAFGMKDAALCKCTCSYPWAGDLCDTCSLSCQNGGTLNRADCTCKCISPWMGRTCEANSCTKACQNGGTLDVSTCACLCKVGWTGQLCETAMCSKDCKHGTLDTSACACACNPNWTGEICDVCTRVCQNGGNLNFDTCECACQAPWTGDDCGSNTCTKKCSHGGNLNAVTCICSCVAPWDGDTCDNCNLSCQNEGLISIDTCVCACNSPWTGTRCETNSCNKTCSNGGVLNSSDCSCACSGAWKGTQCQTCGRVCSNGASLDEPECLCVCSGGWKGNNCEFCGLMCKNGGSVEQDNCHCNCAGGWTGPVCDQCSLECANGGRVTAQCTCECPNTHSGPTCAIVVSPPPEPSETCNSSSQCGSGGACVKNKCQCAWGYFGGNCANSVCSHECANGGHKFTYSSLNRCYCNCFYPWGGATCGDCERTTELCGEGMVVDRTKCECVAVDVKEEIVDNTAPGAGVKSDEPLSSVMDNDYTVTLLGCTQDMPRNKWDLIIVPKGDIAASRESPRHCAALCDKLDQGFNHAGVKYGGYICQCTTKEDLPKYGVDTCNLQCADGEACGADKPHIFSYYAFSKKTAELDEPAAAAAPAPVSTAANTPTPGNPMPSNTAATPASGVDGAVAAAAADGAAAVNVAVSTIPAAAVTVASAALAGAIENHGAGDTNTFASAAEDANSGLKIGTRITTNSPVEMMERANNATKSYDGCVAHTDCSSDTHGNDRFTGEKRGKCVEGRCECEYWVAGGHCELECLRGLQDFGALSKSTTKDYETILSAGYVASVTRKYRMGLGCSGNGVCIQKEVGSVEVSCGCNNGYLGDACQLPHSYKWEKRFPKEGKVYAPTVHSLGAAAGHKHLEPAELDCNAAGQCN